jgi:hypothetical protein
MWQWPTRQWHTNRRHSGLARAALSAALVVAAAGVPLAVTQPPVSAMTLSGAASAHSRDASVAGLPIMKYWVPDGVVNQLQEARDELALRCMGSLGFTSVSAQYGEVSTSAGTSVFPAVSRTADGQAYYEPVNSPGPAMQVAQSAVRLVNSPPTTAEDASMYGRAKNEAVSAVSLGRIPVGGCWGQAGRILYGSHPALPDDPRAVAVASQAYAMQAPDTRAALARWSACMSRAGLRYTSPLQAALDPRWNNGGQARADLSASVAEAQSRTASADLTCRGQANLQQAFQKAEAQYQGQQLAAHLTAIQQSLHIVSDWLDNARNAGVSLAAPHPEFTPANVGGLAYFEGPVTYTNFSYSAQRLDLWHSRTTSGNKVDLYPINGGNAQNWDYSNTLTNGCRILAPNLNTAYAVQDPYGSLAYNAPATIWYYGYNNPPVWYTVSIGYASGYGDSYYVIQNCKDWLYLNPYHGGNGAQLTWSVAGFAYQYGDEVWF